MLAPGLAGVIGLPIGPHPAAYFRVQMPASVLLEPLVAPCDGFILAPVALCGDFGPGGSENCICHDPFLGRDFDGLG